MNRRRKQNDPILDRLSGSILGSITGAMIGAIIGARTFGFENKEKINSYIKLGGILGGIFGYGYKNGKIDRDTNNTPKVVHWNDNNP